MTVQFNRTDLHSSRKPGNVFKGLPLFEYTGINQPVSGKSATPGWARCNPGAQRCPLSSIREMAVVQGRSGPARGAAGQLFQGKRLVVPTRSHSAFCLFCCRRPRSGGFLLDATRCRVWICRVRPLGSHCPCLPARSGARAAGLQSPPVSGAGAGGLHRDLSLSAGRYRLNGANSRPRRLGTAASRWTGCGSVSFAKKTPEPRALDGCVYLSV